MNTGSIPYMAGRPYLQILGSDGVTVVKTVYLPAPDKGFGEVEWQKVTAAKWELLDGSRRERVKGYLPVLTLRWKTFNDFEATGPQDGRQARLTDLLSLLATPPNQLRVCPGPSSRAPMAVTGARFLTGDGVTAQAQLVNEFGDPARSPSITWITRKDWQGVVNLSSVSRTNYLKQSGAMMTSPWSVGGGMAISGGVSDPSGGTQAFTLAQNTGTFGSLFPSSNLAVPAGTYCNAAWVRRRTGAGAVYLWTPNGSGYGTVVNPTSTWQRFSNTTASSGTTGYFGITLAATGDAVDVAFGQSEPGTVAGGYIPTTTAAVSLTDYTHASGLITLGQVPVSGAVLRWGGTHTPRDRGFKALVEKLPKFKLGPAGLGQDVEVQFMGRDILALPVLPELP